VEAKENLNDSIFHAPTHAYVSVYDVFPDDDDDDDDDYPARP